MNGLVDRSGLTIGTTIGQVRKTTTVLYGIFLELTRQIYSAQFQDPALGWVWVGDSSGQTDARRSRIWIDTAYQWVDKAPDFRPAIYVSLAPIQLKSKTGNTRAIQGMVLAEAEYEYSRSGECQIRWIHIGRTHGESVRMSEETLCYLDAFADPLRKEYCFTQFHPITVTPEQLVKNEREQFRSEVVCQAAWDETWVLKLESTKLMKIVFDTGQHTLDVLGLS